ncbi:MAG: twin-arginine translocase subunit TatC [Chitinophagia bacterium]|nr:twin-arginine translocase subunit TatC [Chitinophagia bacterium]
MSVFKKIGNNINPTAEMGFLDHIEALRWHIVRSLVAVVALSIVVFLKIEWIFDKIIMGPAHKDFISYKFFCALGNFFHYPSFCLDEIELEFQNTQVTGQFMMSLSVSMMLGFIVSIPYIFWELWRFIKPALKSEEVRYANGIVFWCSLLFFSGVLFAYFVLAPYTINFFSNYHLSKNVKNIFMLDNYYETMSNLMLGLGLVFQLPVVVYFLSKIGILTPQFMRTRRRYAILILFIVAETITPPDLFSCLLVFFPLYGLFEISIFVSERALRKQKKLLNN